MQTLLTLETNKLEIKLENFQGPLDLLCHLIDKNKMDIYDINLNTLTDQYIEYINQIQEQKLAIGSEFLVMASTLLLIKSRGLLPTSDNNQEEEITEEELIRRIVEYKKYKEITSALKNLYNTYSDRLYRNPEEIELPKQTLDKKYEKDVIVDLYKNALDRYQIKMNNNAKNLERIAIKDTYTVGSKVKEIFRILIKKPKFVFNKMYTLSKCNKVEIVTAFTGLLELSRRNKVETTQNKLFGDITVAKRHRT